MPGKTHGKQGHDEEEEDDELRTGPKLPALPEEGLEMGVLPRVIRTLVERRAVVKKMLKKERVSFLQQVYSISPPLSLFF